MGKFQEYLDEAEAKGETKGKAKGQLSTLTTLYRKGLVSLDDAAECMGKSVDEIRVLFLAG